MTIRAGIAQIDTAVGDLQGNRDRVLAAVRSARSQGIDILAFPELTLPGYPPHDLLLRPSFIRINQETLQDTAAGIPDDIAVIVGFVDAEGSRIFNAAAVLSAGRIAGICRKMTLPPGGDFDQKRYFSPGTGSRLFSCEGTTFGVSIGDDIRSEDGHATVHATSGVSFMICMDASPYHLDRTAARESSIQGISAALSIPVCYANLVGGQDELVFDGQSLITDAHGGISARAAAFREHIISADIECRPAGGQHTPVPIRLSPTRPPLTPVLSPPEERDAEIYDALTLGLHDYVQKNGFRRVTLGLSGGMDSSLVAVIAADAVGSENVLGIFMPSRYSSAASEQNARLLAHTLGVTYRVVPIDPVFSQYLTTLEPVFHGTGRDTTEENLQARIRGTILMAVSNKFGHLVLTTGNKSEISTGYATLYGDMAGGLSVISDIYKTTVYRLAHLRNSRTPVIPERIFTREPTAELRENQRDQDTLPPYDILDSILKLMIEENMPPEEIVTHGFPAETVLRVTALVDGSEYKRRQAPPGIRISIPRTGGDRRMPLTSRVALSSKPPPAPSSHGP